MKNVIITFIYQQLPNNESEIYIFNCFIKDKNVILQ